jgi:hypothetical protein
MYIKSASPKSLSELDTAFGWIANSSEVDLKDIVQELQGIRVSLANGGTASALLEVRGSGGVSKAAALISTSDTVVGALVTVGKGGTSGVASFSLRSDVRIAATPGYISISGASTAGEQVLLFWMDKTGYSAY